MSAEAFGQFLVDRGHLSDSAWSRVIEARGEAGSSAGEQGLGATLTGLGLLSEGDLAAILAAYFSLPLAGEDDWPLDIVPIDGLNPVFLKSYAVLPVRAVGDTLEAIVADPTVDYAVRGLAFATRKAVSLKIATHRAVEAAIDRLYFGNTGDGPQDSGADLAEDVDRLRELATDAPVVRFVDRMIDDALSRKASDIHVEPCEAGLAIRFRVDGMLVGVPGPSRDLVSAVISRLKIMSGLDIAERRLPQDGRMRVRAHGKEIDFRVATSPTARGEGVVLRLLDRGAVALSFDSLGFDEKIAGPFKSAISRPDGIVLVTGPTGSGKTTTLYTGLSMLNTPERKILTVEDPVEYVIGGLSQVQVDARIGRTFAHTLRSFLRQDPDVIMVGEIRDTETAGIAIQAALTGHMVLSTLHTNSAAGAVARMLDMDAEGYLIASTVRLVMAQRLVRRICLSCRREDESRYPYGPDGAALDGPFYIGAGCSACHNTGYAGRTMIAEAFAVTPAMERAILEGRDTSELETLARAEGMRTMFEHGLEKAHAGVTSLAEVLRVTRDGD